MLSPGTAAEFSAALEAQPGYPDAVMSLATADLADGQYESADRRLRGPLADPRPLPAAAVDSPETPTPDSGVVTSRGRGGLARPDTKEPSRRGHRGGD